MVKGQNFNKSNRDNEVSVSEFKPFVVYNYILNKKNFFLKKKIPIDPTKIPRSSLPSTRKSKLISEANSKNIEVV